MQSQPSRAWKLETYHFTQGPKSQVTWGQSVQSQPSRAWKLGSYHFTWGPKSQVLSHLRSIPAISIVESMKVGTYHFTWGPKSSSQVTWGQSVQSHCREHGSWDLPLHMGSQVLLPSHLRSIRAISTVEGMEVGTYHFTRVPSPKSREVNPCNLNPREHGSWGLTTSHGVPSPKSLGVNLCNLNRREHGSWGLTTSHGVPRPKTQVPTMTWMPTWQHFLEVRHETCVARWVEQKARPNSQPKSREYFCIK